MNRRERRTMTLTLLLLFSLVAVFLLSCTPPPSGDKENDERKEARMKILRKKMVEQQIIARGVKDPKVISAMLKVPRHKFVPPEELPYAYSDQPLPIGEGQTISQPYIVALMTEALHLTGNERVLEIGTGSGYQTAVLAEIAKEVYSIEILESLALKARRRLKELGYENVKIKIGDGYRGWKEYAPFDAIIVTAAPTHIPPPLIDQLKAGGRMIIPVGKYFQELILIVKTEKGVIKEHIIPVRFVPMVGEAEKKEPED